jgi:hypothetical protein
MCDNNILSLPVSIGEALDKLSILDIKLDNIKDSRRNNVKVEYDMLYEKLESYVKQCEKYYNMIKKTNTYIWNLMDLLRDGENINDESYVKLCKDTIISNDVRFRIKNKINIMTNSLLKEQKGYKCLKVLIDLTNYTGNIELLIRPLCYYSILYDEIYIKSINQNLINFINKEFNMTMNIIDKNINNYTEYLHIYNIDDNVKTIDDINSKLNINISDINKFIL